MADISQFFGQHRRLLLGVMNAPLHRRLAAPSRAHPISPWYLQRDYHARSVCAAHDRCGDLRIHKHILHDPDIFTRHQLPDLQVAFHPQIRRGASSTTHWSTLRLAVPPPVLPPPAHCTQDPPLLPRTLPSEPRYVCPGPCLGAYLLCCPPTAQARPPHPTGGFLSSCPAPPFAWGGRHILHGPRVSVDGHFHTTCLSCPMPSTVAARPALLHLRTGASSHPPSPTLSLLGLGTIALPPTLPRLYGCRSSLSVAGIPLPSTQLPGGDAPPTQ